MNSHLLRLIALLCVGASVGTADCAENDLASAARQVLAQVPASRPLLLGELHGTREAPAFVGELTRQAAATMPVLVGLEIDAGEQARIDDFLASEGNAAAREALIDGPFWRNPQHDGRDSIAMASLLGALRTLRAEGRDVRVLAFDCPPRADVETRDAAMARCIDAGIAAHPRARVVVLTGNYHARISVGAPWDSGLEFTGYGLRQHNPVAIDLAASRGTAWMCTPECGRKKLANRDPSATISVRIDETRDQRGYHGEVRFPAFEASLPARTQLHGRSRHP